MRTLLLLAAAFVFIAGDPAPTTVQASRQAVREKPSAIPTDQIPPEMFQNVVSMYEEQRESLDFLMAVPELIQRSLQKRKVLIYDQN